jgi:hypothetical protein
MEVSVAVIAMVGAAFFSAGVSPSESAQNTLSIAEEGNSILVRRGKTTLLRYRFDGVSYKPYVAEWNSTAGVNVLRDSPADHKHHHALMFAIKVDGVNFWEEHEAPGRQAHGGFEDVKTGRRQGRPYAQFTQRLDWINPASQEILLQELRTITVYDMPSPSPTLLSWTSRFTVPPGKAKAVLGGAHYHGLGMRFIESMDLVGTFTTPDGSLGELVRGAENLTPAPWCAYTAPAGGHKVTAAMFDAPGNVRPALWFTMKDHFAYLSATVNLWRDPLEVTAEEPLELRYGAALWDSAADKAKVEATYGDWLELTSPDEN